MGMIAGGLALIVLFIGALLLTDYFLRAGGTMEERKAIVFEVYRYTICLVAVFLFGLSAFQLVGALVLDGNNPQALATPGIGVILTGVLFLVHWLMKNPACPKVSGKAE
jgi:hypothetical protein